MNAKCSPLDLPVRSQRTTLAAAVSVVEGSTQAPTTLLQTAASQGAHRLIEVFADAPFGMSIEWSAGSAGGFNASMTSSGRTCRTCVFATSLIVRVWNLSTAENTVAIAVSDAYEATSNVYVAQYDVLDPAVGMLVPPYATHVRGECDDATAYAAGTITGIDGTPAIRTAVRLSEQPLDGIPCGALYGVLLNVPGVIAGRLVWKLDL